MSLSKIFAATVLSLAVASPAMAGQLVINGSTTVLPVMQKAGEAFMASHPDIQLSISGGGSGNGIKALMEGQCNIAMSSRDMKDKEKEACKAKNINPVRTTIAVDAIVPVVNPGNPLKEITSEQLKDIYAGKITNWKEVGGDDQPITLIHRAKSSGSRATIADVVLKGAAFTDNAVIQDSNGAVRAAIASTPGSIGYVDAPYADDSIKILKFDGVEYSPENIIAGKYPIYGYGHMYTKGEPTGAVKAFIDYILSDEFQNTQVEKLGFIPVNKMKK